jgi:hypothetical protein
MLPPVVIIEAKGETLLKVLQMGTISTMFIFGGGTTSVWI